MAQGSPTIGVLALQGDFEAHEKALRAAGADTRLVRDAEGVRASDALVIPGGESTTLWKLMEGTGIEDSIRELAKTRPVFGTCAGAILLAREVTNPERRGMGLLRATAERNAYGRQLDSTVVALEDVDTRALGKEPLEAVFIRAPRLTDLGDGVEVLARRGGDPVLVRDGNVLASTFHPELTGDRRVLDLFLSRVRARKAA
jgi:5'-phosphate synthase pdxT subunit